MTEGKSKLTFKLFKKIGAYFMKEGDVIGVFDNSWSWNLMSRSMNVNELTCSALGWGGDCITVEFGRTKTDKDGTHTMVKHLYCNPFMPEIDAFLALAMMLVAYPFLGRRLNGRLLPTNNFPEVLR